jgi:hypothetical protein
VRSQLFQPDLVIVVQAGLIVIYEDRRGDVHGVDEAKTLLDAAFLDEALDGAGDVDEAAAVWDFEPEVLGEGFHGGERFIEGP